MPSMIRSWVPKLLYRRPWPLSTAVAPQLDLSIPTEEEITPLYHPNRFYPITLGQVLNGRYQIATKLGYGASSTVWLSRDLKRWPWSSEKYVAIKVNALDEHKELEIMRHVTKVNPRHSGWRFVRKLLDSFTLQGPAGTHNCLVVEALREPLWLYQQQFDGGVIPPNVLKIMIQMTLDALDYLHSECRVVHADLKPGNIMVQIEDNSLLEDSAKAEFDDPLPQKKVDSRTIYLSRNNFGPMLQPTGIIQIVDFDVSSRTEPEKVNKGAVGAQPFRAPEVVLNAGYTYPADIWSLGVMLWDLLEPKGLFHPQRHGVDEYDSHSHLSQITALIGPPPQDLLSRGERTSLFYKPNGELEDPSRIPDDFSFESTITCMDGEEKKKFIRFVKRMIKWNPDERATANELAKDPWLLENSGLE